MGAQILDTAQLTDGDLFELLLTIDSSLMCIAKASSKTPKASLIIESKLSKMLTVAWKSVANATLNKALKPLVTKTLNNRTINAFLKKFDIALKTPLNKKQISILGESIKTIYKSSKKVAAKEIKSTFNFAMRDTRAIKAINKQQVLWVGDFYNTQLSGRIRGVTEDIMLKQGLSQGEAGKVLKGALRREFGIKSGGKTGFAPSIPARYAGNPDLYFEQLAATASHQSRTFGRLEAFRNGGIKRYRLINPMDEVTGQICQQMHGQEFSVNTGVRQMDAMLGATKPDDVKAIAPWLSGPSIEEELDGAHAGSKAATDRLSRAGVILPPFHPKCRTDPVAIG